MIELSELRDAAQKAFPRDALVPAREESWKRAAEMGWLMIELPESMGGLGLGRDAGAAIHFEMGKVLSSAPLIPAMLALTGIAAAEGFAARQDWAERICGGEYVPLNLLPGTGGMSDGTITGTVGGVFDADMASHVLAGLPGLYVLVPINAPGVELVERRLWDESRRTFDVKLDGFRPEPTMIVAEGDAARALHDVISPRAMLAVAADSLGGAQAALAMSVEYLKTRKQFDRPLAMFQALKHRCADLQTLVVAAQALFWQRAGDADASLVDLGAMKAHATDVYRQVCEEAIQFHGGIGLTEEHQCHLYMKRAMLNTVLCGTIDHWREAAGRQALAAFAE